jgi:RNA polymerase sigma-70 factor (ECF subfamily)
MERQVDWVEMSIPSIRNEGPLVPDQRARDAALMDRVISGDAAALDEIAAEHWGAAVNYVDGLLRNRAAAEDIVQQALYRLWERPGPWVPNASIRTFLFRIARNLALNERSHQRVQAESRPVLRLLAPEPPTPLERLEQKELRQAVESAVHSLPDRRREAFLLARFHDLSYKEIAEIMGISAQTVANQISVALTQLRRSLSSFVDR